MYLGFDILVVEGKRSVYGQRESLPLFWILVRFGRRSLDVKSPFYIEMRIVMLDVYLYNEESNRSHKTLKYIISSFNNLGENEFVNIEGK